MISMEIRKLMNIMIVYIKSQQRKPNTKRLGGVGDEKKLEEAKGVESKSSIIGTDISVKQLILRRPKISPETTSPNSF